MAPSELAHQLATHTAYTAAAWQPALSYARQWLGEATESVAWELGSPSDLVGMAKVCEENIHPMPYVLVPKIKIYPETLARCVR